MTVPNYFTAADLKAYWPVNEIVTSTVWDAMMATLGTNVSRALDVLTWRQPGEFAVSDVTTRTFDPPNQLSTDFQTTLFIGELADVPTLVSINGLAVPSSDYWLKPYNAAAEGRPYTSILLNPDGTTQSWGVKLHSVTVTGKFGYSMTLPPDVFEAAMLYAIKFIRKAQQNYLETGTVLDSSQVMGGMKVDTDLQELILQRRKSRLPLG